MSEDSFITISRGKLDRIKKMMWSDHETILVAVEAKSIVPESGLIDGYFVCSIGALYIFKEKSFTDPEFITKFTVLDCQKMNFKSKGTIEFELNSFDITVQTDHTEDIAKVIARYEQRMFWNLNFIQIMEFDPPVDLGDYKIEKRIPNSLRDRCILLAHFYNYYQEDKTVFDYFDKWESKPSSILTLGGHFKAGVFAPAIGHALAWENSIENLTVQSLRKPFIGRTLSAVIENATRINKIIFTFYPKEKLPEFELKHIHNMRVKKYWFSRCSSEMLNMFFNSSAGGLTENMEELSIARIKINSADFVDIVSGICRCKSARKSKKLRFSTIRNKDTVFPFDDVTRLLKNMDNLQSIIFTDIDIEGSELLKACCDAQSNVKIIKIEYATFNKAIDVKRTKLPPHLVLLSVSHSEFMKPAALASLMYFLTRKDATIPFIFQAQSITLKKEAYAAFEEIEMEKCRPNLLEFDWSGNTIPKSMAKKMYEFLTTQTKLRCLVFQNIKLQNTEQFWKYLTRLVVNQRIIGLEVTGKFPGSIFTKFIEWLGDATFMQRLNLRCQACHDEGLVTFANTIKKMPELREVYGDGFRPATLDSFMTFWKTVLDHPKIHSCEVPSYDLKVMRKEKIPNTPELKELVGKIKEKGSPTTLLQRAQIMSDQVEKAADLDSTLMSCFTIKFNESWSGESDDSSYDDLFATKDL